MQFFGKNRGQKYANSKISSFHVLHILLFQKLANSKFKVPVKIPVQILPPDPVFSMGVNFSEKVSITYCCTKSKSFKAICFISLS